MKILDSCPLASLPELILANQLGGNLAHFSMVDITITIDVSDVSIEIGGSKTAWKAIALATLLYVYVWPLLVVIH